MIAVTGASGKLAGLVLHGLLEVVPSDQLVAVVQTPEKAGEFASRGVEVRRADYSAPETLAPALAGVKRLLLVAGNDLGKRVDQHRAVIEAAKAAAVELIAYTSVLRADSSTLPIAGEHRATEELLRASGIPCAILRNGWYAGSGRSAGPSRSRGASCRTLRGLRAHRPVRGTAGVSRRDMDFASRAWRRARFSNRAGRRNGRRSSCPRERAGRSLGQGP